MGQTASEKILSRVLRREVRAGEIVFPEPDLITIHDWYAANTADMLATLGVERIRAPEKVVLVTDHEPTAVSRQAAERQKKVRAFAAKFGIERFFDVGRGGHGHIFPVEMGFVQPGMFVKAYDTHVPNFGAVGALGIPLVTEIVEVLACGSVWIKVPETVRIQLTGRVHRGLSIRDVCQRLLVDFDADRLDYAVVEFGGPALANIGIDGRFTLCNTPIENGAKSALVEPDQIVVDYLRPRVEGDLTLTKSDDDAVFRWRGDYDLGVMEPQVAAPPRPDNVVGVSTVRGIKIDHAFVGSCASSLYTDIRDAATILKGRTVSAGVRMFVTPGTQEIWARADQDGLLRILVDAGVVLTAPGCGPCAAGRIGPLAEGEVSINTGTRNDPGRLGPMKADIYLASPLTVAASAVAGEIVDPREFLP
ncbi:MAG: homoaconitate hydratase family protein [Alphaproteobacteria bacterium]|nr:homoaconitate hydratase family protein [Alphaproteobacteria bacterium]